MMGKRHPNPRLAKVHRSYSVAEVAALFKIHKNTVRAWRNAGLQPIDDRRPVVFLGKTLAAFIQSRRVKAKRPLLPSQIYCVACREAKEPALGMADYVTPDGDGRQSTRLLSDVRKVDSSAGQSREARQDCRSA